jgi:DNA repair exonuclease SbcCD nuclease subunit
MKRRRFIKGTTTAISSVGFSSVFPFTLARKKKGLTLKSCVTLEEQKVSFFAEGIDESIKVIHIADTHLFKDDERGIPFQEFSGRMAKAYNETIHFQSRLKTTPEESFEQTLDYAKKENADVITLVGDIFSFPSELAIEWVQAKLKAINIPYIFVAGNHDWHYEGMEGTQDFLRETWIKKRLSSLYQGNNPLMASYDIKGVRFLAIDNSTYEINDDQLTFFNQQVAKQIPLVLLLHIPMYAPGKGIYFGCGNPNWGGANDRNFQLEKRPIWPEKGHTKTTFAFYKSVFNAPSLLGVFAGHIHQKSIEIINGIPQIVTEDNASGGYLEIDFLKLKEDYKKLI